MITCTLIPLLLTGATPCQKEYLEATSDPQLVGRFVPTCREDGFYAPVQCHGSTGFCWCVTKDGKKIPNTDVRGRPNCKYLSTSIRLLSSNGNVNECPELRPNQVEFLVIDQHWGNQE